MHGSESKIRGHFGSLEVLCRNDVINDDSPVSGVSDFGDVALVVGGDV